MALTSVTSFVCFHSVSPQAMVSGAKDYPPSLHQKQKLFYLIFPPLFAFYFEPAVLQCMCIQHSVLLHHWWNELFQSVFKQDESEQKWRFLIGFDDFKADVASVNFHLCLHLTGVACWRNPLCVRCCKGTALFCPRLQNVALVWCAGSSFEEKMLFIVFSDGQWMWYISTFKPVLPTQSVLFLTCLVVTLSLSHLGCCVCFKTDEIIPIWLWMKLDIEEWVPHSDLRQ